MKAALYVRVSTLQQVDRDSLKTQEERLKSYCKAKEFSVYNIYKDAGISAKDQNRPALEALLKDAEDKKFEYVVFTRLDRITRSVQDLLYLVKFFEQHNVKFLSLDESINTEGAMGRFVLNLLGSVAQLGREMLAERVSTDMHHRAEHGRWNGGIVPFGYTTREKLAEKLRQAKTSETKIVTIINKKAPERKKLYVEEDEAQTVKKIYETYLKEKSLRKGVTNLNTIGIRARKGQWTTTTLRRVLTNPFYLGFITYGKRKTSITTGKLTHVDENKWKIVKGEHQPIIPEKTFKEVQELMHKKTNKPTKSDKTYLLSGILKCAHCGGKMYGYTHTKKLPNNETKEYLYYRCATTSRRGVSACKGQTIDGEPLETIVTESLLKISENQQFLTERAKLIGELKKATKPNPKSEEADQKQLDKQEQELSKNREVLLDKLEKEIIDDDTFKERFSKIEKQLLEIRNRKQEALDVHADSKNKLTALEASFQELSDLSKTWPSLSEEAKKSRLSVIVKEVLAKKVHKKLKMDMTIYVDSPEEFAKCAEGLPIHNLAYTL